MLLADVDAVEIDIYMPVGDTIDFEVDDEVLLFLNTDPSKPIKANLRQTSFEPRTRDNGDLGQILIYTLGQSHMKGCQRLFCMISGEISLLMSAGWSTKLFRGYLLVTQR